MSINIDEFELRIDGLTMEKRPRFIKQADVYAGREKRDTSTDFLLWLENYIEEDTP